MGNLFSKRKEDLELDRLENNLELYLHDVHEKECLFKIEEEEVEFIQRGIETLVQDHINVVLSDESVAGKLEIFFRKLQSTCNSNESYLQKVYSSSKLENFFQEYTHIKAGSITLLKVGSFYEGTKNCFPDEFDLIFPIACIKSNRSLPTEILNLFFEICDFVNNLKQSYTKMSLCHGRRKLVFKRNLGLHGPAFLLQFVYKNGLEKARYIHVDLVPAIQGTVAMNMYDAYEDYVNGFEMFKSFQDRILAAGTFLFVNFNISCTETEVDFIRNVLSDKHKKVYRILKFLINGDGDDERLEDHKGIGESGYNSYQIKIMIIYHHDVCTNSDSKALGPCVLQVLKKMSSYEFTKQFPVLGNKIYPSRFILLPYLKFLIEILEIMQTSDENYDYETKRIKSLSSQYLHDIL